MSRVLVSASRRKSLSLELSCRDDDEMPAKSAIAERVGYPDSLVASTEARLVGLIRINDKSQ
ncbi:MAG: hypothetical protein DMF24_07640 [Verrucomicrobia bacterium]|nr:MAG: hypothetical protein DMF24_07640 [Verrucomicrobiota bacterium]